jgi:hypothetical protein
MTADRLHSTCHAPGTRCRHVKPGARCRSGRFFTHLPGAGPSPGKSGGPGRSIRAGQRAARPRRASVRPPGHARPRTSQDTGQTIARRSPPPFTIPPHEYRKKENPPVTEMHNDQEKHGSNSPGIAEGARIISYNLNEDQRPDGLKVRYKVRIETGRKAAALDAAQAQALKELLQWARHYRSQHPQ